MPTIARILPTLPHDAPLIKIRAQSRWTNIDLKELWAHRELLFFLTWRDIKVRYKQTFFGVAWALIQPLLTMVVFTILFGRMGGFEKQTGGVPYPLFALAGLLPWMFFSNAVSNSGNSLVGSAHLITKVYFPRVLIPASAVLSGFVDFLVAFGLVLWLMVYYGYGISDTVLYVPFLTSLMIILALGVGMATSALNVKYRDVRYALPFIIQLWMFVSPVIYPPSMVPDRWQWALKLNPLTGIIGGFRAAMLGTPIDNSAIVWAGAITIGTTLMAFVAFRRFERQFADIV